MLPAAAGVGAGARPSCGRVPTAAAPGRGAHPRVEPRAPGARLGDAAVVHGRFEARAASSRQSAASRHAAASAATASDATASDATATTTAATPATAVCASRATYAKLSARSLFYARAPASPTSAATSIITAAARTTTAAAARTGLPSEPILGPEAATTPTTHAQLFGDGSTGTIRRAFAFNREQW